MDEPSRFADRRKAQALTQVRCADHTADRSAVTLPPHPSIRQATTVASLIYINEAEK
jgi:hypothetical protein